MPAHYCLWLPGLTLLRNVSKAQTVATSLPGIITPALCCSREKRLTWVEEDLLDKVYPHPYAWKKMKLALVL